LTKNRRYWLDRGIWLLAGGLLAIGIILLSLGIGWSVKGAGLGSLIIGIIITQACFWAERDKGYIDLEWEHYLRNRL